jgi:hypothetical protein
MFGRRGTERRAARDRRALQAAGAYVSACIAGDEERMEEASAGLEPFRFEWAVAEVARRAVTALARERQMHHDAVLQTLIEAHS